MEVLGAQANNNKRNIYCYDVPKFDGRNVPVKDVAKLMGKDQQFIRQGIINGKLPIGTAFKKKEDVHKMAEANKAFAHYRW